MPELAKFHPDQPEEEIPPYSSLPSETELDKPADDEVLPKVHDHRQSSVLTEPFRLSQTLEV